MSCFGIPPKIGQTTLLLLDRTGDADDLEVIDGFARFNTVAVHPQHLTELGGIAAIGLATRAVLWLNQYDAITAEVTQHLDQPIVKPTDLHDRLEAAMGLGTLSSQLLKEFKYFLRTCADLAFEDGVAIDISQVDG